MAEDKAKFGVELDAKQAKREAKAAAKALGKLQKANEKLNTKVSGAKANLAALKAQGKAQRQQMASARKLASIQRKTDRLRGAGRGRGRDAPSAASGALSVFAGNLMTAAVSKAADLAATVASAAFEMVQFGQTSRLALGQLAKHGAEPEKLFTHARELAKRFGLDVMDTTHQYQKFLALQFTPKGADKLLKMGADLQVLGNSAEDVQGVFTALGQIKSKGKFQAEEGMQLAERGISGGLVTEEIGKLLGGKTGDQVRKLQQAGKITADVALQAIENAINRKLGQSKLGESGAKFADTTIGGMLNRIKAMGQDSGVSLVDKVTAPLTKITGKGLDALDKFLSSPEGAANIDRIAAGLGRAAEFMGTLAEASAGAFGETFKTNVEPMFEMYNLFSGGDTTAKSLGKTMGDVAAFSVAAALGIGLVGGAIGKIIGPVFAIGHAILEGLITPIAEAWAGVYLWFVGLGDLFADDSKSIIEKVWGVGVAVVKGLANGIWSVATLPFEAMWGMATKAVGAVQEVFDVHSPSRVTMGIGQDVGRGLAIGTDRQDRVVEASGQRMAYAHLGGVNEVMSAQPSRGFGGALQPEQWNFGPAMSSASSASPISDGARFGGGDIIVNLHTEVSGVSGDAEEIGRIAARESRREIESFFRQLSLEV